MVCVVPVSMVQAGMMQQQPMQIGMTPMMMVAPMAAPGLLHMMNGPSSITENGNVQSATMTGWPAGDAQWVGYQLPQEQAPMQHVPMANMNCIGNSESEAPAQTHMPFFMAETVMGGTDKTSASGLYRRKGQAAANASEWWSAREEFPQQSEVSRQSRTATSDADYKAEAEARANAEAQQLASTLLMQMRTGGNARASAIARFREMAFDGKVSCMAAQLLLEQVSRTDADALALILQGDIRRAVWSKNANHVLQKIIDILHVEKTKFIIDEIREAGAEVTRHVFGCRVMCRILEHISVSEPNTVAMIDEILLDAEELCNHKYGSFVIRHILEFGLPHQKHRIVDAILPDLSALAKDQDASHVVEAALQHAEVSDQRRLAKQLLRRKEELLDFSLGRFGHFVAKALLSPSLPQDVKMEAVAALHPMEAKLKSARYGKSVWQALKAARAH